MNDREPPCCSPGCCGDSPAPAPDANAVREQVRAGYAAIAATGGFAAPASGQSCGPGTGAGACCGPATFSPEQLAAAIGYATGELGTVPEGANLGLSCGNPTAIAALRPGEIVLDLGAGGGFDCFVAGPKVGAGGRVIGVDMTPEMLQRARSNLATYRRRTGLDNVEFRLGEIEHLPVADQSVDVVISNCVLNLSPDKAQVWREIARVLKPNGRVAVSDMALLRPLPEAVRASVEALVGCIAGAELVATTQTQIAAAGLVDATLRPKPEYVAALARWDDPLVREVAAALPPGTTPGDFVTSLDIAARKP
jgi:SAM-dependent methyltransferase